MIDPATNSIGYLYLLDLIIAAASPSSNLDKRTLLDKVVCFLTHFEPLQMRYVGTTFRNLLERVASGSLFPVS